MCVCVRDSGEGRQKKKKKTPFSLGRCRGLLVCCYSRVFHKVIDSADERYVDGPAARRVQMAHFDRGRRVRVVLDHHGRVDDGL